MNPSNPHWPSLSPEAVGWMQRNGLKSLQLASRRLLAAVQGGMGIGISGKRLAPGRLQDV